MNRLIALGLFLLAAPASAQWINSIWTQPPGPTVNDFITVYVNSTFPTASCNEHSKSHSVVGNIIEAKSLHCLGMLTVLCDYTDTFAIGQLPAGSYLFNYWLLHGPLPFPCQPDNNSGVVGSMTFTVSTATGLPPSTAPAIHLSPQLAPRGAPITISLPSGQATLTVLRPDATVFLTQHLTGPVAELPTASWPAGLYLLRLHSPAGLSVHRLIRY
ncbi:MAG: hypothetical protein NZM08_04830 [Chitinophagales bacterium]|nr:hypothetical protein [Chitinophagales bacterium]